MLRRSLQQRLHATPLLRAWTAEEDEPGAPDTTFKNVKPHGLLRLWRQIRQRAWVSWAFDEEYQATTQETFMHQTRMEQITYAPTSSMGSVPGSYADPLLYNTKSTSPFRWHSNGNNFDVAGHWYMEADELFRIKDWAPKNPDDPYEMFPRPPQMNLSFEETIDEHGNRHFKYKYRYDFFDPHGQVYPAYPFNHHYAGGTIDHRDRVEAFGFKQGELLRCTEEEEEVLRRVLEEEDREWSMVKQTELVQEPWSYPGKIRPRDLHGAVDRAKARWREDVKAGRPTDPTKNPEYDLVKAGEYVEPRDGPRAEWRHMWRENLKNGKQEYQSTGNDGDTLEANENVPPKYPTKWDGPLPTKPATPITDGKKQQ